MKLVYNVNDKPKFGQVLVFALQQLLAILAATIAVPAIISGDYTEIVNGVETVKFTVSMSQSAALFGAGIGTLVYLLFTKFKSPVFLGSSFAFLGSMGAAFAGAISAAAGFMGLLIGAVGAGLVYVIIAIVVKFCGVKWINKLMPAVVIGPTVAIIGLSLAGNAVSDLQAGKVMHNVLNDAGEVIGQAQDASLYACIICGLITLFVTMICSVYGKKFLKMIPFIMGIAAGYLVALVLSIIGKNADIAALRIIDLDAISNSFKALNTVKAWVPDFSFLEGFKGIKEITFEYVVTVLVAYVPVAFVVFAEHIADHKNLSSIIESDLLENPGLHRTLLGDGVGSMAGAFFGGCPNTTYGESVGCVAISGNASIVTILTTAVLAIVASFLAPFTIILSSIPNCVMGGVCVALYGFIAVSGLKMIQSSDLGDNRNLFVVSVILIAGIGGLTVSFGKVTITSIACALILGIITNLILKERSKK